MLARNQTPLLHEYFTRHSDLWLLCEQYDCDHDQMLAIIGAITPYLPGKGLDYNAILSQDPIACDHLVLHCHRAIGQLDGLYDPLISLFDSVHDGTEKIENTTLQDKQRFRVLETALKCLERGLKMQITLTQRQEKLQNQPHRDQAKSFTKPSKTAKPASQKQAPLAAPARPSPSAARGLLH